MKLGMREFRADVAASVRRAAAGEQVTITVGGRPVAQLGPLDPGIGASLDALLASGQVIAPRRVSTQPTAAPEPVPVYAGVRLDRLLRELRG